MYKLGSLVCAVIFEEPVFDIPQQSHALQRALFRNLRGLDLRLDNFSETAASGGIAQWSLNVSTQHGIILNLRIWAHGFESTFPNPGREVLPSSQGVLEQIENGIVSVLSEARILARNFSFHAHIELPPGGYQQMTAPFAGEPPVGLGVHSAQGMSFYFHSPELLDDSAVILDRSTLIADGLYFQVGSRFGSENFDLASSFSIFQSLVGRAIESTSLGGAF